MKSSKNIHVLATPNPSRLFYLASNLHLEQGQLISPKNYQNIYITSDEEIKEGDKSLLFVDGFEPMILTHFEPVEEGYEGKKIILTTDQDLDGVQAINDDFLEWFVNNPSCEEVEIKRPNKCKVMGCDLECILFKTCENIYIGYEIIIPKEEPKPHILSCCRSLEECYCGKHPKQETLEEAAEKYANESFIPMRNSDGEVLRIPPGQTVPCGFTKHKKVAIKHFTSGYKLGQERSYSEEDLKNAFECAREFDSLDGTVDIDVILAYKADTSDLQAKYITFEQWFEQFKKK